MRNLVDVFGDRPKVRLLEALLAMAPHTFTRAELAAEAGLRKGSANRIFPQLESLNLVRQITGGGHPKYEVATGSSLLAVLQALEPALAVAIKVDQSPVAGLDVPGQFHERLTAQAHDAAGQPRHAGTATPRA